jgi:hypothetical protein
VSCIPININEYFGVDIEGFDDPETWSPLLWDYRRVFGSKAVQHQDEKESTKLSYVVHTIQVHFPKCYFENLFA